MRIFITGGTGFIGKHVVKKLVEDGHELLILSRRLQKISVEPIKFLKGDLEDIESWSSEVKKFKPDVVIHLAWEGLPDYRMAASIKNFKASLALYEFLVSINCKKIITIGTCWEYLGLEGKVREEVFVGPQSPFIAAKHALRLMGDTLCNEKGVTFIWLRPFFVYGPGQRSESLIATLYASLSKGMSISMDNPLAKNDYVYVEDVAEAVVQVAQKADKSAIYNIGSGSLTSNKQILKLLSNMMEKKYNLSLQKAKSKQNAFYADITKITKEIGWQPKVTINEGIKRTLDYLNSKS